MASQQKYTIKRLEILNKIATESPFLTLSIDDIVGKPKHYHMKDKSVGEMLKKILRM
jgi:hypothetical protein